MSDDDLTYFPNGISVQGSVLTAIGALHLALSGSGNPIEEGAIQWNAEDGTIDIGQPGGTSVQLGQELGFRAKNTSGDDLINGTAITISGGSGNNPTIDKATRAVGGEIAGSIGFTTEDIGNNQFGRGTIVGLVRDVDTSLWPADTRLVLSDTDGEVVSVASAPLTFGRNVFMGISIVQHADVGVILSYPVSVPFLNEISGVRLTNQQDGDVLTFDSATGFWINQAPV